MQQAERDISEAARSLTAAQEQLTRLFRDEIASDYYAVLVFQNGEQLDAFVKATGLKAEGETTRYLDGTRLAKLLGIALPPGPKWKDREPKSKLAALAMYIGEKPG